MFYELIDGTWKKNKAESVFFEGNTEPIDRLPAHFWTDTRKPAANDEPHDSRTQTLSAPQDLGATVGRVAVDKDLATIRAEAFVRVRSIRGETQARFAKDSAGVPPVYDANYEAAVAYKAGSTDTLRTGQTPEQHLSAMAPFKGMTTEQFADWIISENSRLGPVAHGVEVEYMRAAVATQTAATASEIWQAVDTFAAYCEPIDGE